MTSTDTQPDTTPEISQEAARHVAWFVCRHGKITDDVVLNLAPGALNAGFDVLAKRGRMRAARVFKARHKLHPCVKVDCEFQGVAPEGVL